MGRASNVEHMSLEYRMSVFGRWLHAQVARLTCLAYVLLLSVQDGRRVRTLFHVEDAGESGRGNGYGGWHRSR